MSTPFAPGAIEAAVARSWRSRLLLAALMFAGAISSTFAAASAGASSRDGQTPPRTRHVLFINSYQPGYQWSDDLVSGVREVLDNQAFPVELWIEYMDSRRFSGPIHDDRFERYLQDKYRNHRFDLIISSDDAALMFVSQHRDRLFPAVPVVFMGLNNWELAERLERHGYTGVREIFHTDTLVDTALFMRPGTTRFVVIGDAAPTATAQLNAIRTVAARRPDVKFVIYDGANLSLEEILDALSKTTVTDAIITTSFTRDHTGRYFPPHDAILRILAMARGPVLSESACHVRQGILACAENVGVQHGKRGAEMAAAVLSGTPPESIPIESADGARVVVDYREVRRWGIDSRRLPADAIILHAPSSFYQANKVLIWSGVSFIGLQAVVITALAVNISRRRQVEGKLAEQAKQLAMSNADLQQLNESLRKEITERHHAEEQLRQAQKMEAIGRLAGGVAHDFNNLLTVIGGCACCLVEQIGPTHPARRFAEEVQKAGERAAALTKQLLAFGRKQVLSPVTVSLNDVVRGIEPMLRRLLGEDLDLELALTDEPTAMVIDAGQIEQVIMNLAINARDAMPHGGRLVIETRVVRWKHLLDIERPEGPSTKDGQDRFVVQLRVRDTGHGMDAHTRAHIFEPFYSTKGLKGTGLGLATVYGIVTQSGGAIAVRSEPGQGATFIISLPRTATAEPLSLEPRAPETAPETTAPETTALETAAAEKVTPEKTEPEKTAPEMIAPEKLAPEKMAPEKTTAGKTTVTTVADAPRPGIRRLSEGKETVLLVEDEPAVRTLTAQMLRSQGYTVVEASSADHAVSQAADVTLPIDLLLTDVVMPGMSGYQLAMRLTQTHPGLKVLFMSGYTDNVMAQHGVLEPGTELLQKPFTLHSLGDKVRAVLDA